MSDGYKFCIAGTRRLQRFKRQFTRASRRERGNEAAEAECRNQRPRTTMMLPASLAASTSIVCCRFVNGVHSRDVSEQS